MASGLPAKKKSSSRGDTWQVDTVAAVAWTVARAIAEAGIVPAAGDPLDLDAERARLASAQADKVERENAHAKGELLEAKAVRRVLDRCVSAANARLGAIPSRLAHIIRPDDPVTARRHLELAVEEVRAELRTLPVEEYRDDAA